MNAREEEFLDFAAATLGIDRAKATMELKYGEIAEWDSVMQIMLAMKTEQKYGKDIPIDQVPGLKSLGDFYRVAQC